MLKLEENSRMRSWRKLESDYVQMIIYKEVKRSDEGSGCW